jgi:hypothetical protein
MHLQEKIISIYPQLTPEDFLPHTGTISLRNDLDGRGYYIETWTNELPCPTEEQLNSIA